MTESDTYRTAERTDLVHFENHTAPNLDGFDLLSRHAHRCLRSRSCFSRRSGTATGRHGSSHWKRNERTALSRRRLSRSAPSGSRRRLSYRYIQHRWTPSGVRGNQRRGSIPHQPAARRLSDLRRFASPWWFDETITRDRNRHRETRDTLGRSDRHRDPLESVRHTKVFFIARVSRCHNCFSMERQKIKWPSHSV